MLIPLYAQTLSKNQYAVVALEDFDAEVLAAADYVFLAHQDPRAEYAARAEKSASKSAPELHRAFQEHGKWQQHACFDSSYERAASDVVRKHTAGLTKVRVHLKFTCI